MKKVQNLSICTQQQREAIRCGMGPTLVVAGAGSGKTLVLAKRFEYLINEKELAPESILLLAFSNKAANNMKKRIFKSNLVDINPEFAEKCQISTFHKFAMNFLKEEQNVQFHVGNIVYEKKDKYILREVIEELGIKSIRATNLAWQILKKVRWLIKKEDRKFKIEDLIRIGTKITGNNADDITRRFPFEDMKKVYKAYEIRLNQNNIYPFDDMILNTHLILKNNEKIRQKWNEKFQAILCDEFQDVDDVQFEILKFLCQNEKHIFCVGDPDQSIFGFRNAVPGIFQKFNDHFQNKGLQTEIKKLEQNFRSTPNILEVANKIIENGLTRKEFSKNLFSDRSNGKSVSLHVSDSPELEEERIIEKILDLNENHKVPFKEIAVLARNYKHSETIMLKLMEKRIPYDNKRDVASSLNRQEIKDLISWLDISLNRDERIVGRAMKRVINKPARGIGPKKVEEIFRNGPKMAISIIKRSNDPKINEFLNLCVQLRTIASNKNWSTEQRIIKILEISKLLEYYKDHPNKVQRIRSFLKGLLEEERTIERIREKMTQWTPKSLDGDEITISTIHGVKGLEFKHVFLMKLSEGLLPSKVGLSKAQNQQEKEEYVDEERRLMYVAVTRAKDALYLSTSSGEQNISRFVLEVKDLLDKKREYSNNSMDDILIPSYIEEEDITFSDQLLSEDTEQYLAEAEFELEETDETLDEI